MRDISNDIETAPPGDPRLRSGPMVAVAVVTGPAGVVAGRRRDGVPPWVLPGSKVETGAVVAAGGHRPEGPSQAGEAPGVAPTVVYDGGVDEEFHDHARADLGVDGGRTGTSPPGRRQDSGPGVTGPGVRLEHRGDRGGSGRIELGGPAGEQQLIMVVVAAQQ
jgi:hypothetical protein